MFFCYGSSPASWIAGNDSFSVTSGLSGPLAAAWDDLGKTVPDKSMTGSRIRWISTSPTGVFCIMLKDGNMMTNAPGLMQAVAQSQQQRWGVYVDHVAFAPSGSWIIIYNDYMVQVSPQPQFSAAFYALAGRFMCFDSPSVLYPQPSQIRHILFGADDIFIINANLTLFWSHLPPALSQALEKVHVKQGSGLWSTHTHLLTYNTVLSPFDTGSYVLEAAPKIPVYGQGMAYEFGGSHLPGTLPPEAFVELAKGNRLGPHLWATLGQGTSFYPAATGALYPPPPPPPTEKPNLLNTAFSLLHTSLSPPPPPPYSALSPPPPPPPPPRMPSTASSSASNSSVPAAERRKFEAQFDANCQGRSFLTGMEAAALLTESGLDKDVLSKIWEKADGDRNGRFDREEFVQAMWLVSLERDSSGGKAGDEPKVDAAVNKKGTRLCSGHLQCDGCGKKMWPGSTCYYCETCKGGDFDLCDTCQSNPFKRCSHDLELCTIALEPAGGSGKSGGKASFLDRLFQPLTSEMEKMTKKFEDTKLKESLEGAIVSEKPNVKWEDVAGLEPAKEELQEAIIFPLKFPHMFQGKRKPRKAILMYGPPGTGKSYLAKAVATEVNHTLFSISSGDVMSKWFGESEGLVRGLFQLAREMRPSIIFIDEIDALCSNREGSGPGDGSNEHTARMKTEFLVQLDGVGNDNDGVLVLAATNLPWALDPAVRRRFQKRIHIPLPDEPARRHLFRIHGGDHFAAFSEQEFEVMARLTDGCSGSDVANLVQDALMVPVKKVHVATHFRKVTSGSFEWLTPCQQDEAGAMPMTWKQVPAKQLKEPKLLAHDVFDVALKTKPSVGKEEVQKCHQWTEQYGVEGA